jgi:regulatory protein
VSAAARSRTAKPPTAERLRRRALFYLQRFAASRERLRRVLERRARRDAEALELPWPPVATAIAALLDDLERLGLLDDSGFAEARARSLAAKGRPPRRIAQLLAAEGIARPLIDGALATLAEDEAAGRGDLELETAIAFARRRRLGPFAPPDGPAKPPDKAMAAFARAGFSSRIARRLLKAETVEELEAD